MSTTSPTREEFERTIEASESRMDARVARLEGKIDAYMAAQDARDAERERRLAERDLRLAERDRRIEMLAASAEKSAESARTLKGHFWGAVLTIILSVGAIAAGSIYATQQSNIAIVQAVQSSYQHGRQSVQTPPTPEPAH